MWGLELFDDERGIDDMIVGEKKGRGGRGERCFWQNKIGTSIMKRNVRKFNHQPTTALTNI